MNGKALICDEKQNFSIKDVILKDPLDDQIVIKTKYTGVSIGTEFAFIRNKLTGNAYPLCTGYMGTGIVESVGSEIDNFTIGDKVYFRGNESFKLIDGTPVSSVSGGHCSHIILNPNTTHGADKVIEGAGMNVASMFVMPAVGLYGVDMVNPRMGDIVVVYGVGLIGLGVTAFSAQRGCTVIAVDINQKQLEIAKDLGADFAINGISENVSDKIKNIVSNGADVVFECTGIPENIDIAISLCRTHGSFVWQGNYGSKPISMHFLPPHGKRLKMFFPCDDGWQDCRKAVIKSMAMGILKWEKCITHQINYSDAPNMFQSINQEKDKDIIGVVIKW